MTAGRRRWWERLVEPHPSLTEVGDRLRATWLSALVLALIVLGAGSVAIQLALVEGFSASAVPIAVALGVLACAYLTARSRHYRIGGIIAALVPIAGSVGTALAAPADHIWYGFMLLPVLLASVFLSTLAAAVFAALSMAAIVAAFAISPVLYDYTPLTGVLLLHAVLSPVVVLGAYHRNKIEREREHALRDSLVELRETTRLETVGRLAGGIAHDLNNLLTVMYVNLDLIERRDGDDPHLAEIRQVADRAASLTHQLLAFARKQVLDPVVLDPSAALVEADALLRRLLGADIELDVVPNPHVGHICADPAQLEQIIINLALNARDAMPDGGRLTIELDDADLDQEYARDHAGSKPGRYVRLSVADTGVGMDEHTRDRVFEPFFTTKGTSGTGLGLATVHGIAAQSGGHITVDSEPGRGTCFRVYLPRVDAPATEDRAASPALAAAPRDALVLIVEDDDTLRRSMRDALFDAGYRVLTAASGDEALEIVATQPDSIDVMLSDVVMPGTNGREVADRIVSEHAGLKVLLVSGYAEDLVQTPDYPHAFLGKPFTAQLLVNRIDELIASPGGAIPASTERTGSAERSRASGARREPT